MPTIRDTMKQRLKDNGLSDLRADAIMAEAEKEIEQMQGRWGRDVSDYPPAVINLTYQHVKVITLKWIDENAPQAWFRSMFE